MMLRPVLAGIVAALAGQTAALAAEGAHALIIGVSNYAQESRASPLPGVPYDVSNARRMAEALGVPASEIVELRDDQATKEAVMRELQRLRGSVQSGDRVLVYFSGHGTRQQTPEGCREGFSTYTGEMITEAELARFTEPLSRLADKLLVILDACFSGGVIGSAPNPTRSLAGMQAKFTPGLGECAAPVNHPASRSLLSEFKRLGVHDENFVQISSANFNEVSWDNPVSGGIATRALSECLLGEARDLNHNGAVTLEEVRACAQQKMDATMAPYRSLGMLPSTLQVRGNRNLVVGPAPEEPSSSPTSPAAGAPSSAPTGAHPGERERDTDASQPSVSTLEALYQQRDPRRHVEVSAPQALKVGRDGFQFSVRSSHDGYLYVVMLGSDRSSYSILFPNRLAGDNRVRAGVRRDFPAGKWQVKAGGPSGDDKLLFMVTQSPRDLSVFSLASRPSGDFSIALADEASRRRLVDLFLGRGVNGRNAALGATLIDIREEQ